MQALMMRGRSFDCGNKLGFLQANMALGLQDDAIAPDMVNFLHNLLQKRLQSAIISASRSQATKLTGHMATDWPRP